MFGFFNKKQIEEKHVNNIFLNLTLLQSWSIDKRKIDYSADELRFIAEKIANNIGCESKEAVATAVLLALSNMDLETGKKLRAKANFDADVIDFCKRLKLDDSYFRM